MKNKFYIVSFLLFIFCMWLVATGECQEIKFSGSVAIYNKVPTFQPAEMKDTKVKVKLLKEAYKFAVLGISIYLFEDNIKEFSNKYDKLSHLILGCLLTEKFGWKFALGATLAIEGTQVDIFGIKGRYKDTILDLASFVAGMSIAITF